jgi:hypothetical protein
MVGMDRCPACSSACRGRITGTKPDNTLCPHRWHDTDANGHRPPIESIRVVIRMASEQNEKSPPTR